MKKFALPLCLAVTASLSALPDTATAYDGVDREGRYYIGALATTLNHRKLGTRNEQVWTPAVTLVGGTHITNRFYAEWRAGLGLESRTVKDSDLELEIDHYLSWYMGLHHRLTPWAKVFGQFGVSYIKGDGTLTDPDEPRNRPYRVLDDDYPGSSFSLSWLGGMDFQISSRAFLVLEGGRLFKDTVTNAATYQFSGGLRYEF
ncbi:MAG: porin family protein [Marinobacter sp.]|nr:porin family protein [Marinobacter sp.]